MYGSAGQAANNARSNDARHGRDASKTDAKAFRLCGEDPPLIITSGVDCTRTFIERCQRSRLPLGATAKLRIQSTACSDIWQTSFARITISGLFQGEPKTISRQTRQKRKQNTVNR